jgi:Superfamily I DNA and RNA helicases
VQILVAETADDELERIADEIEQVRDQHDVAYEDIAVALKYSGEAVIEAMQALEQAGIPTESATVIGFGDDPAIRELLQVVYALTDESTLDSEGAIAVEEPDLTDDLRTELAEMDHLGEAVRRWASKSGLKERIAADTAPLTARTRFSNVRRAFNMADFLEDTAFMDATWGSLAEMLTRAHEYAPQQNQTSAIERDGGVRVDHVRALKNGSFRVVFIPQMTDERYPGQPQLSSLFPQERVTRMPDYPGVSQVEADAVTATFATDSTASSRPVRQYHAEHARRLLAVATASATERLYVSLHTHEDTALDERVQPSRFLADAYRECPWLTDAAESPINTELAAEKFLLSRVDKALADVRRANSQDVTISLDDVETDFAEIQALLADSGERGEQLRDALHARLDFAAGRVRRE